MIRHYRDLVAWQRSMDLVQIVYELTAQFPVEERFGLPNQMRRSAVSGRLISGLVRSLN